VHFGRPRVPDNLEDLAAFQIGGQPFGAMATDALAVFASFLQELEARTPAWRGKTCIPDAVTESEDWRAQNLSDRTALLREIVRDRVRQA
jgi:hypothetical protein